MAERRVNGEGSTPYQREGRKGWYQKIRVTNPLTGESTRKTISAPTLTKLSERRRELLRAAERGQPTPSGRATLTVSEYADGWMRDHLAARDITPGTRRGYRHSMRAYVLPVLGGLRLARVRATDAERVDARMQGAEYAAETRKLAYRVMSMMFDTAVRDGLIAVNPAGGLDRPASRRTRQPRYTAEELERLYAAIKGARILETVVPLMLWTATRPGEALALRWEHVDLEARVLWVQATLAVDEGGRVYRKPDPKDHEPRPVPLVAGAIAALKAQRAAQRAERMAAGEAWADSGLVFTTPLGGLVDDRTLRRRYQPLVKAAGLTGSFQSLRRSTATLLIDAGVPLPIVSEILGHSSGRVTQAHYVTVSVDAMRTALDAMGDRLAASGDH